MKFSLLLHSLLTLTFALPLRAETSPSASAGAGDKPVAGTTVDVPAGPEVTASGAVKPMDRQKSSAMAKAMAAAGSTQSMIACMQMMQAAQNAKGSDKAMMMMMANQSCQQGKEMAKAAEENDKSEKQISAADTPKQASIKINEQKLPAGSPAEDNAAMAQYQAVQVDEAKNPGLDTGKVSVLKPLLPELDLGKAKVAKPAVAQVTPEPEVREKPNLPKSVPALINGGAVTMQDGKKNEGPSEPQNFGPNLAGFGPSTAGTGKSPAEEAKLLKGAVAEEGETRKKNEAVGSGQGAEGGASGGGSSGSADKGPDPFEAMLAQLMGGPPPEDSARGGAGDFELEPRRDHTKPPNIFEYAKFRYLKLVDQKKLKGQAREAPKGPISRDNSPQASLEASTTLSKR